MKIVKKGFEIAFQIIEKNWFLRNVKGEAGLLEPKQDDQINKNHMTKYFLPYDWINSKPDDQINPLLVTLLRDII